MTKEMAVPILDNQLLILRDLEMHPDKYLITVNGKKTYFLPIVDALRLTHRSLNAQNLSRVAAECKILSDKLIPVSNPDNPRARVLGWNFNPKDLDLINCLPGERYKRPSKPDKEHTGIVTIRERRPKRIWFTVEPYYETVLEQYLSSDGKEFKTNYREITYEKPNGHK